MIKVINLWGQRRPKSDCACAVWSGPSLSSFRIFRHRKMHQRKQSPSPDYAEVQCSCKAIFWCCAVWYGPSLSLTESLDTVECNNEATSLVRLCRRSLFIYGRFLMLRPKFICTYYFKCEMRSPRSVRGTHTLSWANALENSIKTLRTSTDYIYTMRRWLMRVRPSLFIYSVSLSLPRLWKPVLSTRIIFLLTFPSPFPCAQKLIKPQRQKTTSDIRAEWRFRSDCAFAQSNPNLHWAISDSICYCSALFVRLWFRMWR